MAAHRLLFALTGALITGFSFDLPVTASSAESKSETVATAPARLTVQADRQYIDTNSKSSIAEGNVSIQLGDAELHADRVEFDAIYRTFFARGAVRFKRGSQYFQASSFRYNLVHNEGQLEDVYGVIDLGEPLKNPLITSRTTSALPESAKPVISEDIPPVVCPPLLPPARDFWGWDKSEPESVLMPPRPVCEGLQRGIDAKSLSLSDHLESIALGEVGNQKRYVSSEGTPEQDTITAAQQQTIRTKGIPQINQRISKIALRDSLIVGQSVGIPTERSNSSTGNKPRSRFGVVRPAQMNGIRTDQTSTGRISRWRVQASKVLIMKDGWKADRMGFSNDPYTPAQIRIDAEDVIAREKSNGDLLISARRNRLIVEERLSIPLTKRQLLKEGGFRWTYGIDNHHRDGLFIGRNLQPIELTRDFTLSLQPQFMVQRAIDGETTSYPAREKSLTSRDISQPTTIADLFGLKAELNGKLWDWGISLKSDISTFEPQRFADSIRFSGNSQKNMKLPWIGDVTARLFGATRYRMWNGSLGETEIYSALGGSIDQRKDFKWGNLRNSYLWRMGVGLYQAESLSTATRSDKLRVNLYGSLDSSYPIWSGETAPLTPAKAYRYSPVAISPGLDFNTNVNTLVAAYEDGRNQATISLSGGPTLTLGTFSKPFLDYTQLSLSAGVTFTQGASPFEFDQAIDLGTLGIGITQQIAGPLVLNAGIGVNVDPASKYYGDVIDSNIELLWRRRTYDIGFYFDPYEGMGGFRFRLHDFDFKGTGVPFVPYTPTSLMKTTNADRPF